MKNSPLSHSSLSFFFDLRGSRENDDEKGKKRKKEKIHKPPSRSFVSLKALTTPVAFSLSDCARTERFHFTFPLFQPLLRVRETLLLGRRGKQKKKHHGAAEKGAEEKSFWD